MPDAAMTQNPAELRDRIDSWPVRYRAVRGMTERLCRPLAIEDYVVQSMPDASPAKWHLAHTTWFFETFILRDCLPGYRPFDPDFGYLFNSYYESVGPRVPRPQRGLLTRPTVERVYAFRQHVDAQMERLAEMSCPESIAARIELGLHHEQQHQELLLTDIKHAFGLNPLRPAYRDVPVEREREREPAPLAWSRFEPALVEVGHFGEGFAFDNESPRHRVYVNGFQLANRLVTNGEYERFIEQGGYEDSSLWLSDGWHAVRSENWQAPLYWEKRDGRWWQFTLYGMQPVWPDEPVCHVSFFEADAFARWAGARLPTEFEWERASVGYPVRGNFVEQSLLMPRPAIAPASEEGLAQLFGDVWEWTASAYLPYPGFRTAAGALGEYNGKFMSGQMVLRGGSCASSQSHLRGSYRNFFPPVARWQFSGIRLAQDVGVST